MIPSPNMEKAKTQTLVKGQIDTNLLQGIKKSLCLFFFLFSLLSLLKTIWPGVTSFSLLFPTV
jgi:hypothetical protein